MYIKIELGSAVLEEIKAGGGGSITVHAELVPEPADTEPAPVGPLTDLGKIMAANGRVGGLEEGEHLTWVRPNKGESYELVVAGNRLASVDGRRQWDNVSRPCGELAGGSYNGWDQWRRADGTLIGDLRPTPDSEGVDLRAGDRVVWRGIEATVTSVRPASKICVFTFGDGEEHSAKFHMLTHA